MSVSHVAARRRSSSAGVAAPILLLLVLPLVTTLMFHAASLTATGAPAVRLSLADARRSGLAFQIVPHRELAVPLIEVRADASHEHPAAGDGALLAAAPDGSAVAIAERRGQDPTTLVVVAADGGQLRVPMPGLLAAAFAPDGSRLVATDGLGRLWGVDAGDGTLQLIADGPFAGTLLVEASGAILALGVSSVEAPFLSSLLRVEPESGLAVRLSEEELVYGMSQLADGTLAVVAHRPDGTVLQRVADDLTEELALLGPGAVNVSISADAGSIAWQQAGEIMLQVGSTPPRSIGPGENPRLAADGTAVVINSASGERLIGLEGSVLAELQGQVALLACAECGS